jgi:hypothetical protein
MSRAAAPTTTTVGVIGGFRGCARAATGRSPGRPILLVHSNLPARRHPVYFYELHEGDDEVYSDVLLYSDSEWEPDEFFELVQAIRRRVQESYEDDTLIEAIAVELERDHGFVFVSDDRLIAAVQVSRDDEENFLVPTGMSDEDDDEADDDLDADYVTITAEMDRDATSRQN